MRRNWEEKPPCASAVCDMMLLWAGFNSFLCRTGMRFVHHSDARSYFWRKTVFGRKSHAGMTKSLITLYWLIF